MQICSLNIEHIKQSTEQQYSIPYILEDTNRTDVSKAIVIHQYIIVKHIL